jgi:curved DNA-binding protein CbpA
MAPGDAAPRDPYRVLGVDRGASGDDIRSAYRDLAWRLHPDRSADASPPERAIAERRMREVNEAFSVLGQPARRRAHDAQGRTTVPSGRRNTARSAGGGGPAPLPAEHDDLVAVADDAVHGVLFHRVLPGLLAAVLLAIVIVSAFAGGESDTSAPSDPGCVLGNTLVDCDGPHDGRIRTLVVPGGSCPDGTTLVSLADDYCVEY